MSEIEILKRLRELERVVNRMKTLDKARALNVNVEDDLRFPATSVKLSGTKPPTSTALWGGEVLSFSDQAVIGNEEYIYFDVQLSHRWKEGTNLRPHVHWLGQDTTAGNVYWRLTYSWADIGAAFGAATPIYVAAANNAVTTSTHTMSYFPDISGVGHGGYSGMLICSLSRHSSNALDTYNGKNAYLLEIDFHIDMDTLGS